MAAAAEDHIPLVDEVEQVDLQADDDSLAVPTELLQEDTSTVELPSAYAELGVAKLIAAGPKKVLAAIYSAALLSTVWVLLTPGDKFSVSEDLFIARHAPDVRSFYDQGLLETASTQLSPGYVYPADRRPRRRASHLPSQSTQVVTLVYERRGLGSPNVRTRGVELVLAMPRQLNSCLPCRDS